MLVFLWQFEELVVFRVINLLCDMGWIDIASPFMFELMGIWQKLRNIQIQVNTTQVSEQMKDPVDIQSNF